MQKGNLKTSWNNSDPHVRKLVSREERAGWSLGSRVGPPPHGPSPLSSFCCLCCLHNELLLHENLEFGPGNVYYTDKGFPRELPTS